MACVGCKNGEAEVVATLPTGTGLCALCVQGVADVLLETRFSAERLQLARESADRETRLLEQGERHLAQNERLVAAVEQLARWC